MCCVYPSSRLPVSSRRGFSLVEMIVYMSIVVMVAAAAVSVLLSLGTVVQQYQAEQTLLRSNVTILERILLDVRTATAVNLAASTLDDPKGTLVLTLPSGTVTYQWVDGEVERQLGADVVQLQQDAVSIEALQFSVVSASQSDYVRVVVDSAVSMGQGTSTRSYTAGAVTRAAYE